jgi:hypothetical protein
MENVKEIKKKDSEKGLFFQSATGNCQALFVTRSSASKSMIPKGQGVTCTILPARVWIPMRAATNMCQLSQYIFSALPAN